MNQLDWPAPAPRRRKPVSVRQEAGNCHVRIHQLYPLPGKNVLNGPPWFLTSERGWWGNPWGFESTQWTWVGVQVNLIFTDTTLRKARGFN